MQELVAKSIESSDLNFSRYGDTFFEASFFLFLIEKFQIIFFLENLDPFWKQ